MESSSWSLLYNLFYMSVESGRRPYKQEIQFYPKIFNVKWHDWLQIIFHYWTPLWKIAVIIWWESQYLSMQYLEDSLN